MANNKLTPKIIVNLLEKHKEDIHKYGVKKIGIFGSFLNGKNKEKSDIDILVSFDEVSFKKYIRLKFLLEELFRKKVDLVIEGDLRPELNYVKKEAKYARL